MILVAKSEYRKSVSSVAGAFFIDYILTTSSKIGHIQVDLSINAVCAHFPVGFSLGLQRCSSFFTNLTFVFQIMERMRFFTAFRPQK
jgi:hypothetical protein